MFSKKPGQNNKLTGTPEPHIQTGTVQVKPKRMVSLFKKELLGKATILVTRFFIIRSLNNYFSKFSLILEEIIPKRLDI